MDARKITNYSALAEVTFIETGVCEGVTGYWFSDRNYKRVFVTDDQLHARLDLRKRTLFASSKSQGQKSGPASDN